MFVGGGYYRRTAGYGAHGALAMRREQRTRRSDSSTGPAIHSCISSFILLLALRLRAPILVMQVAGESAPR